LESGWGLVLCSAHCHSSVVCVYSVMFVMFVVCNVRVCTEFSDNPRTHWESEENRTCSYLGLEDGNCAGFLWYHVSQYHDIGRNPQFASS